jgi:hypothetical protein
MPIMPATALRPRSPAQIEASRRNGARSRGPVTPEGKARASRNALKHGLAAIHHLVLEDETPSELEELTARLLAEVGPESEIEARLVRRMAIAFWKGERAERIEVALFDAAPRLRPPQAGFEWEEADPLTTFDLKRFNAVRGYQAQQGRELSRCLKELRMLRREPLVECTGEPESALQNEPGRPPEPANDDASIQVPSADSLSQDVVQNKPKRAPADELPEADRAELDRLLAADDWPGLARLADSGALLPLGLGPADLASPAALGRAFERLTTAAIGEEGPPMRRRA